MVRSIWGDRNGIALTEYLVLIGGITAGALIGVYFLANATGDAVKTPSGYLARTADTDVTGSTLTGGTTTGGNTNTGGTPAGVTYSLVSVAKVRGDETGTYRASGKADILRICPDPKVASSCPATITVP